MSSPFARATNTIPIPFDLPNEVTVQQLNARQLGKAQKAFFNELIAEVQVRGGAKIQKDIQQLWEKTPEEKQAAETEVAKVKADPLNGFDKYTLLYDGIKAWTYPDSLERVSVVEQTADGRSVTVVRVPAIDALNDDAVTFFATEVLRITKPSLFLTKDEQAAEQKNA
jgi:hypothetical protein